MGSGAKLAFLKANAIFGVRKSGARGINREPGFLNYVLFEKVTGPRFRERGCCFARFCRKLGTLEGTAFQRVQSGNQVAGQVFKNGKRSLGRGYAGNISRNADYLGRPGVHQFTRQGDQDAGRPLFRPGLGAEVMAPGSEHRFH